MQVFREKDYDAMSRRAASIIASAVAGKPDCVLGLATGSSPVGTYDRLIRETEKGRLSFARVRTVNLDEYRGLGPEHVQSYRYFMDRRLFSRVDILPENTHLPDGLAGDVEAECGRYDELIRSLGGIDLQLLGIGHNGHIGFNEPAGHFPKDTHCVALTESTIQANSRLFDSPEEVPRFALTMGVGAIMSARRIVLLASGEGKAGIVRKAFWGPVTPQVPASVLQFHPDFILVADEAALSLAGE